MGGPEVTQHILNCTVTRVARASAYTKYNFHEIMQDYTWHMHLVVFFVLFRLFCYFLFPSLVHSLRRVFILLMSWQSSSCLRAVVMSMVVISFIPGILSALLTPPPPPPQQPCRQHHHHQHHKPPPQAFPWPCCRCMIMTLKHRSSFSLCVLSLRYDDDDDVYVRMSLSYLTRF